MVGWLNGLGQLACTASTEFGLAKMYVPPLLPCCSLGPPLTLAPRSSMLLAGSGLVRILLFIIHARRPGLTRRRDRRCDCCDGRPHRRRGLALCRLCLVRRPADCPRPGQLAPDASPGGHHPKVRSRALEPSRSTAPNADPRGRRSLVFVNLGITGLIILLLLFLTPPGQMQSPRRVFAEVQNRQSAPPAGGFCSGLRR